MSTQNKEIKIALDIQAKIDKASDQIGNLKKQIDNFELSKGLASEFAKEFKHIEHDLAELQRKTASGEINLIDAKSAEKEIDKIEKRWAFLVSKIGGDGFLEKGLKSDAQVMTALEALTKSYAAGIKEAEVQETRLNKKLEEAKQKQKELIEVQKEQKVVKASELEDQKAQLAILEKQEKAAKKARDDAEKALRAKVDGSAGKYDMSQISQKGSPLRKTDAYRTFREAQSTYESAKTATKTQKANVESMTTKQMQAAEAMAAKEAIDKATEALENYRKTTLATAKEDAFKNAKESLKSIAEFKDIDWDGLGISMSEIKSVEELEEALIKLRTEADDRANDAIKEMETTTKDASQGFQVLGRDIKNAEKHLEEVDEQARRTEAFENRIKQFLGMAGAVELLRRALRQAFETTKELDAAMTEMAVVTNLDVGDYWDQLPDHTKRASELGVAIKDVYEAETLYYQQGLKTADAQALANTTLKMARIAGLDAAEATDKMTAALRGFNMELDEASAEKVADVYSELAAITAADVNEISSAMTKTASIASAAGMEFETTAAFLSQIIETTRESAETAGTAMKTVIARFSEVKKLQNEGIMSGEDSEGEVIDVNKIQTALRTVGISMDDFFQGTEGLDSVFLKLAERWDTLDVKTQRYIATTAAGSRQQSRFIAMMSDYARTQELVTAANDSAGASQKQYEKTLESIESKLAKLKNAWDEFSMGILESDLVKVGVDILTKFLEIINKATSAFNGLGGSIMKIMTVVSLFKLGQKVFEKFKTPLMQFFSDIIKMSHDTGYQSGKAFLDGEKQAKEEETQSDFQNKLDNAMSKESPTALQKLKKISGKQFYDDGKQLLQSDETQALESKWQELSYGDTENNPLKRKKAIAQARQQKVNRVKETEDKLMAMATDGKTDKNSDEYLKIKGDVDKAQKELVEFDETQLAVQENAQKGWNQVGQGIQQMGSNISAVGIGVSMLGGIFQSLGLEEVGEVFTWVGSAVTMLGGAISFIGTLTPIVAKILVASGYSIQGAFWPVLIIGLALAALVGTIVAIVAVIKSVQAAKLENRMAAAAEATEKAKEAAEAAKEAYDDLLSERSGYDEMQKNLENLTYGTKQWKEALHEVNQQVLKLIQTYPELAQYLNRGKDGQLTIDDEGWDALLEKQKKAVANTQSTILSRQIDEQTLKDEEARTKFTEKVNKSGAGHYQNVGGQAQWVSDAGKLRKDLEEIYLTQDSSLEEIEGKTEELAKKYNTTTDAIKEAGDALKNSKDEITAIADQTENIARASLTAQASDKVLNSKFGDEIIDAFAQSVGGKGEDKAISDYVTEMNNDRTSGKLGDSDMMKQIGKEYNINFEAGSDKQNLQEIYAAMTNKTIAEVKEGKMSTEQLTKAIAEMQVNSDRLTKMEAYVDKLAELEETDKGAANDLAALLSDDGRGMSAEFITGAMDGDKFNKSFVEESLAKANLTAEDVAAATGKTVEDFWKEVEENARKAQATNDKTYEQLNRVLGKSKKEINKFGENIQLTTETQANLSEKIVGVTQATNKEMGGQVKESLDILLESAGEDAEKLGELLGSITWSSAEDWEELSKTLESVGLGYLIGDFEKFKQEVYSTGMVVDTINLEKLNTDLLRAKKLIESIESGEQNRVFSKETYESLVAANEDIANQFVQIGEEFHFVGTSLQQVADTLKQNMYMDLAKAEYQLSKQAEIGEKVAQFGENGGALSSSGKKLDILSGSGNWSVEDKRAYLDQYRDYAKSQNVTSFDYITDESGKSLGMSLGMNFEEATEAQLDEYIEALRRLESEASDNREEVEKKASDRRITGYTLEEASSIVSNARNARAADDETKADEYSKALSIEAANSGMVAEAVISEYNSLLGKDLKVMTQEDKQRMSELEDTMASAIEENTRKLEDLQTVNEMTNRVAQALSTLRQKEIDELSRINDSINSANQTMLDKVQQQINNSRTERQNEKTEQAIADKQSQLAYLMADTSGASTLGAQALQKEILADQESYQDNLIDQGLQKLSDQNAAAAEQRERQISILEAQLDYSLESGQLMREAETITQHSLDAINNGVSPLDTDMYRILAAEEKINGGMATNTQQEEFEKEFIADAKDAADASTRLEEGIGKVTTENTLTLLNSWLQERFKKEKEEQDAADIEQERQTAREDAMTSAVKAAAAEKDIAGSDLRSDDKFSKAYEDYSAAGGTLTEDEFFDKVSQKAVEYYDWYGLPSEEVSSSGLNDRPNALFNLTIGDYSDKYVKTGSWAHGEPSRLDKLYKATSGEDAATGSVLYDRVDGGIWIRTKSGNWYQTVNSGEDDQEVGSKPYNLTEQAKKLVPQQRSFKTGGLADFTGPAWLDGTKSHPELVLNQRDTQNFIQLKDILAEIMDKGGMSDNSTFNGDNYFDIQINVEDISDDYDVEQLANKIRSIIYEDAIYRNVNAVSHISR